MTIDLSKHKYLLNCQDGANNVERATVSLILGVTASKTSETAIFLTSDASYLGRKDGADGLQASGFEPLADLLAQFVDQGGKIWLCKTCAKNKNIAEDDLINGAEITGAPRPIEYLASGAHLLA